MKQFTLLKDLYLETDSNNEVLGWTIQIPTTNNGILLKGTLLNFSHLFFAEDKTILFNYSINETEEFAEFIQSEIIELWESETVSCIELGATLSH